MNYREIAPPPALADHVTCFWRLTGDADPGAPAEPIVPDGRIEIVLNLADQFIRHEPNAAPELQPKRLVAGQLTRAATISPTGRVDIWGIRLHPWSGAALLGVAGYELRDQILDLGTVASALDRAFASVATTADEAEQEALIICALVGRASRVARHDQRLRRMIGSAMSPARRDDPSVRMLAKEAGLSSRSVQVLFRDCVGLSPKQLLRITRFQRALGMARFNPTRSWSTIAADAGYHDHAHLLHESNAIAGCTPNALLGRPSDLTSVFLSDEPRS